MGKDILLTVLWVHEIWISGLYVSAIPMGREVVRNSELCHMFGFRGCESLALG